MLASVGPDGSLHTLGAAPRRGAGPAVSTPSSAGRRGPGRRSRRAGPGQGRRRPWSGPGTGRAGARGTPRRRGEVLVTRQGDTDLEDRIEAAVALLEDRPEVGDGLAGLAADDGSCGLSGQRIHAYPTGGGDQAVDLDGVAVRPRRRRVVRSFSCSAHGGILCTCPMGWAVGGQEVHEKRRSATDGLTCRVSATSPGSGVTHPIRQRSAARGTARCRLSGSEGPDRTRKGSR